MNTVIIAAAGSGSRMRHLENKVFIQLGEYSILQWSILQASRMKELKEIIIVIAKGEEKKVRYEVNKLALQCPIQIILGGATRQESVRRGLASIQVTDLKEHIVLIHDAARPLATTEMFERCADKAQETGSAIVAVPTKDTIKVATESGNCIEKTLPRKTLWMAQTPQAFNMELLMRAHQRGVDMCATDDASLLEEIGEKVSIVEGSYDNIKITTPSDIVFAKQILGIKETPMRVGFGYDIHRLVKGRPCILGGVLIPSAVGLDGHSDADVVVHALMDALLGAAGLRDIGYYFPPTDDAFKGASSLKLLEQVVLLLAQEGYYPNNVDMMIIGEVPKVAPYIDNMKDNLANILGIARNFVSIKATTNEGLGAIGRREGIAAQAVVSIVTREA